MDDPLWPLPLEDVDEFVSILHQDLPYTSLVISWIKNSMRWKNLMTGMKFEILCPYGKWRTGSFIGLCSGIALEEKVYAVLYARKEETQKLGNAVEQSTKIPWSNIMFFTGVVSWNFEILEPLFIKKGFSSGSDFMHFLSSQEASQVRIPRCPEDVTVVPLDVNKDLEAVCTLWPYFIDAMKPVLKAALSNNHTIGVFVNGTLASMALQTYHGGVGVMQTLPQYRGRGLATLALASLTKTLGEAGISPQLRVVTTNQAALSTVRKVGFKIVDQSQSVQQQKFYS